MKYLVILLFCISLRAGTYLPIKAACQTETFIDFEGGVSGAQITLTALTNCYHGDDGVWNIAGGNAGMSFTNFSQHTLGGTILTCNGVGPSGGYFTGAGSIGFSILNDNADDQVLSFWPTNGGTINNGPNGRVKKASFGVWIKTDMVAELPNGGGGIGQQHDIFFLKGEQINFGGGGNFLNPYINNRNDRGACTGSMWWGMETSAGDDGGPIVCMQSDTWYYVTGQSEQGVADKVSIYSASLVFLAEKITLQGATGLLSFPSSVQMRYQSADSGTHIFFDSLIVDFRQGRYPLLPF